MQKIYLFLVLVLGSFITNAQLVFNDNFSGLSNGNLSNPSQGSWVTNGSGTDVQVASTISLAYGGYGSGAKSITTGTNGRDPWKLFSTSVSTTTSKSIFISFSVRVTTAVDGGTPHVIALRNTADSDIPLRFYIQGDYFANTFEFGIEAGSMVGSTSFTSGNFVQGTTYLIVIRYDINSSSGSNDDAYLWVNPTNYPAEPLTSAATGATGASDVNNTEVNFGSLLNALQIQQDDPSGFGNGSTPVAAFDLFLVAQGANASAAWINLNPLQAALPVDMKSIKAIKDNTIVKISWEVGTENNVLGYEVQRSKDGSHFDAIGFVNAAAQPNYAYIDDRPLAGTNFYRVVTIDNDRRLKYTSIVSVDGRKDLHIFRFPNPTTNTLLVQHQEVSSGDAILRVTSFDGKVVKALRLARNSVQTNIDVSTLRSGNYLLEFVNGGKRISTTFIKQ